MERIVTEKAGVQKEKNTTTTGKRNLRFAVKAGGSKSYFID
jgi:hypothetical protein